MSKILNSCIWKEEIKEMFLAVFALREISVRASTISSDFKVRIPETWNILLSGDKEIK